MTEAQFYEGIYLRWQTGWEALHGVGSNFVPYTYRNESFAPSQLGALGAYARVSVIHTSAEQVTQGSAPSRKFERRGNVFVQLFAPIDAGVALLASLAGDVRTVLEGQNVGSVGDVVNLHEARTEEGAEDGTWAQSTVVVRFRYVDTR